MSEDSIPADAHGAKCPAATATPNKDDPFELARFLRTQPIGTFKVTLTATPEKANPWVEETPERTSGIVTAMDRKGLWIQWDSNPGFQTLFPQEGWKYTDFKLERISTSTAVPVIVEDDPPPRPPPRQKRPRQDASIPTHPAPLPIAHPMPVPQPTPLPTYQPTAYLPTEDDLHAKIALLQAQVVSLTRQPYETHGTDARAQQIALAETIINRTGRLMISIVDGVRVPAAIDAPYQAIYPHIYLRRDRPLNPSEIAVWRSDVAQLVQHLGVQFRTPVLRDRFELARDTLFTIAAMGIMPVTKSDYRVLFWHIFTMIESFVTALHNANAADVVRRKLYDLWYGDAKFDFETTLRAAGVATEAGEASTKDDNALLKNQAEQLTKLVGQCASAVQRATGTDHHRPFRGYKPRRGR